MPASNILYNSVTPGQFAAQGGTLIINGNSTTAASQTFGSLSISGNAATSIQLLTNNSQPLLLNIGTFTTRSSSAVGSVVDFTLPSGSQTSTNGILTATANTHGIIGAWATVAGQDWATNSGGNIVALPAASYSTFPQSGGASSTNALLSGSSSLTGADTLSTLKITDTGASQSLALSSYSLSSTGLLYVGGSTNSYSISGTGVLGNGTGNEFIANVASGANLTVSAPLVSTTATAGVLTKAGAGTLTYSGASGYTGATYVSGGTLALSNAASNTTPLGNTAITVNTGTTLAINKNGSTVNVGTGGASVKLLPGATLNVSDGTIGTFNINTAGSTAALTLVGDDTLQFGVGSSGADEITASGGTAALSIGASTNGFIATDTINIVPVGNSLGTGSYPLIYNGNGAATGGISLADFSLADPTLTVGGQTYDLSLSSPSINELDLNVSIVPEPATGVFLLALVGMTGLRRPRAGKPA